MKKRKWTIILIPIVILALIFVVFYAIYDQKDLYKGTSKDDNWRVSIEKSEKTSIGPNYFLNLYWQGSENNKKKITVKNIKLIVDGEVYEENGPYNLSEYTGEHFKDGGEEPDHISTFSYMLEEDIKDHQLEVKIEWNDKSKDKTTVFKLEQKSLFDITF
ncbi:DUF4944 domain-containing protein [Bacillus sp. WMMC1349]|uniref:DUF4944 domain-containing protein n=1 Tax=Bacillus sp. WMMC1349 TaxID=2736254 RepID=UPI0015533D2E|nr:DUF4944 domain-containing protein [Bacillus sp. WMMC1349]NPC90768.1 DUF4944 domain-containing protein [Bacillus sp. WMMC1349]NPC91618.1 DUF4944 domain-containing protein [Bacillus sp. WMMC1349]